LDGDWKPCSFNFVEFFHTIQQVNEGAYDAIEDIKGKSKWVAFGYVIDETARKDQEEKQVLEDRVTCRRTSSGSL
jgi:hypothetical protein